MNTIVETDVIKVTEQIIPSGRRALFLSYISLLLLAIGFLLRLPATYSLIMGAATVVFGTILSIKNKPYFCYFIILSSLLGPVYKIALPGVGMFNIGDALLGVMAISLVFLRRKEKTEYNRYNLYFYVMILCVVVNIFVSGNFRLSISGLFNMIEIAIVYLFTYRVIRTRQQAETCIYAIAFAAAVAALLHIYSFTQGINMNLGTLADDSTTMSDAITGMVDSPFVKTSFFYGNFTIICSIVAVIGLRSVMLSPHLKLHTVLFWIFVIILVMVSGSLSARTPLTVVFFLGLPILFILIYNNLLFGGRIKKTVLIVLALITVSYIIFVAFNRLFAEKQQSAYITMFREGASFSMGERFDMLGIAIQKPLENTKDFLFGIGPNMNLQLFRSGSTADNAFQIDGDMLISFHNFFIDTVYQLGIFFSLSIIIVVVSTCIFLLRILRNHRFRDGLALDCLFGILAFILTGFTLGAAWSKPYIIVAQLLSISHLLINWQYDHSSIANNRPEDR